MRNFLIDYENVNSFGLAGISRLDAEDRVVLFYSQSANTLNFEILDEIMQSPVRTEKVNLNQSGRNALDFQLVTYLGYLIAKQSADDFYIISRDMGYVATQQFCKKMLGVKVQIKPSIRDALADKTSVPVKKMTVSQPVMLQQPAPVEGKSGNKKSFHLGSAALGCGGLLHIWQYPLHEPDGKISYCRISRNHHRLIL